MKKPEKKKFMREYGPRGHAKFHDAMRKYRKSQKGVKLGPPTPSTSRVGRLTDPMAARASAAAGRKKPVVTPKSNPVATKPKTVTPKTSQATTQPAKKAQPAVPVKAQPKGPGVQGSFRKSNPASPTVKKRTSGTGRSRTKDPRERSVRRNLREAQSAKARRERRVQFTEKAYGGHPMNPPKNPKEGDTYKKPFGPVMIYKNGKFVRK